MTRKILITALTLSAALIGASPAQAQSSFTPLGDLAGGDFNSLATGVNADGSIVVGYGESANGQEAFLARVSSR